MPSGENGGFASLAAKGTCYSGNGTTAISFNGDLKNQYAALLRSNTEGNPASIAKLRSANFAAGNGILFSALSETTDAQKSTKPVNLVVRILDSEGKPLSELSIQTAVINLAPGCPSSKRDTAFSVHYIDTRPYNGEISVEFRQQTNSPGFGFFTLIDNVILVENGQIFVNQTQPIAIAGTSLTSSNILFLDPRDSIDPDNLPAPLQFSWFINDEETIRLFDLPCINLNSNIELTPGNHVATLYATDGVNYSADTLRFVVGGTSTTTSSTDSTTNNTTNNNIILTTPKGDPIVNETNQVSSDGVTLTDPQNECDIDVASVIQGNESDSLAIDVDSSSDAVFNATFTIGAGTVNITSSGININSPENESVTQVVVTINNADANDTLNVNANSVSTLNVSNTETSSVTISPNVEGSTVSDSDFEIVLEALVFEYTVNGVANTDERVITYSATDSASNSVSTTSTITIQE